MDCEYCHKPTHLWYECKDKPSGWKPARLVKDREPSPSSDCKSDASPKEGLAAASSNLGAPTKADLAQQAEASDLKSVKVSVRTRESAPFDKKTWMREYMRSYMKDWRARKKASAEGRDE